MRWCKTHDWWYYSIRIFKHALLGCFWIDPSSSTKLMLERYCAHKHVIPVIKAWHVTRPIEQGCSPEHDEHVSHAWYVPLRNYAAEWHCSPKHAVHISYLCDIPKRYVRIEWLCAYQIIWHNIIEWRIYVSCFYHVHHASVICLVCNTSAMSCIVDTTLSRDLARYSFCDSHMPCSCLARCPHNKQAPNHEDDKDCNDDKERRLNADTNLFISVCNRVMLTAIPSGPCMPQTFHGDS